MVVGNLLPPCELKFGMQQSTLPTYSSRVDDTESHLEASIDETRPQPSWERGPGGPSQAGPDRNQQESGCISNDSSVVCYLVKKCNIDVKTCNCYFVELDYEPIRLI